MTQARTWAHGNFHWNEPTTRGIEQAKAFFGDVIGWITPVN